jgi:deoxyribose-phosphate aldolase
MDGSATVRRHTSSICAGGGNCCIFSPFAYITAMDRATLDRIIREVIAEKLQAPPHACHCVDGKCVDSLCVIHNKAGVQCIVDCGAARVTSSIGVDAAGGVEPDLARMIDHTLLKPEATPAEVEKLCVEARKYSFASVCINPSFVPLCARLLRGSPVKVCTVIGFPLGAMSTSVKAHETEQAIRDGATEVDMVINVGMLKAGEYKYVESDIFAVTSIARRHRALSKVIIETALLSDEEKVKACVLAKRAGADFVKTSTGFSKGGATAGDIALMRRVVGSAMGVKASGGVRSREDALTMVASGADRIGASASVKIVGGDSEGTQRSY